MSTITVREAPKAPARSSKKDTKKGPRQRGTGGLTYDAKRGLYIGSVEVISIEGKRKRVKVSSKDEKVAQRKLRDLLQKKATYGLLEAGAPTFKEWVEYWMEHVSTVRPTTMRTYRSSINRHIMPTLGGRRLDKIDPVLLRNILIVMQKERSFYTAQTAWAVLSSIFRDAFKYEKVTRNPMLHIDKPKGVKPKLRSLTREEAQAVILAEPDNTLKMLWATALFTGMRRGELVGLEWDRVLGDRLDISHQLVRLAKDIENKSDVEYIPVRGQLFMSVPKTDTGERIIPLVNPLRDTLEAWRQLSGGEGYVFKRPLDNGPFEPVDVMPLWKVALERVGITDRVRLHDARHTAIELMYDAEVPERIIIEIVGHSAVIQSRKYRTKYNAVEQGAAMEKFSTYLDGGKSILAPASPTPLAIEAAQEDIAA